MEKQITTTNKPVWTGLITQPKDYYNNLPAISQKEILTNHHQPIGAIKTQVKGGLEIVQAILVLELDSLNKYFNVPQMNITQRTETISLLCERLNHWKLDDFKLLFKNMKAGVYGKMFNRIDGGVIFDCVRIYDQERQTQAELINKAEPPTKANPEGQKRVIEILKEFVEAKPEPIKKGKVKTEYDLVCQSALEEFDKIYNKGKGTNGKRFITVEGKVMDQTEFMQYKINQYQENKNP